MQQSELLSTLAEVSIAFAGFTGVVGMLGFGSSNRRIRDQLFQVGAMIGFSLIAALFSLVPLLLSALGFSEPAVWRSSSLGLLAALVGWSIVGFVQIRQVTGSAYRFPGVFPKFMFALTGFVSLVLLANAAGFLAPRTAGTYVVCTFVPLLYAGLFFIRLFFPFRIDQ